MNIWLKLLLFFTVYGEILIVAYASCRVTKGQGKASVKQKIIFTAGTFVLAGITYINKELNYFGSRGYFLEVILVAILLCFVRPKVKVLVCSVSTFLFILMAYLDLSLSFMLIGLPTSFGESLMRNLLYILSRLIILAACFLINKYINNAYSVVRRHKLALIVLDCIGLTGFIHFCRSFLDGERQLGVPEDAAIFLFLGMLLLGFYLYYFWRGMKEQKRAIRIHDDFMERHYKRVIEEQKKSSCMYHDFRNHMNLLSEYLQKEDYITAKAYIEKLQMLAARGEYRIYSGNRVLDALLNEKKWQALERGIEFTTNIESIKKADINDYDLCVIAGNLLDNALEACSLIENLKKWIKVSATLRGDLFLMKVENSMEGAVVKKDGKYMSSKKEEGHGLGLQSTEEAVARYNGRLSLEPGRGMFSAIVTLTVKILAE